MLYWDLLGCLAIIGPLFPSTASPEAACPGPVEVGAYGA